MADRRRNTSRTCKAATVAPRLCKRQPETRNGVSHMQLHFLEQLEDGVPKAAHGKLTETYPAKLRHVYPGDVYLMSFKSLSYFKLIIVL